MNVEFDGQNLLIKVNEEITSLDVQTDIYSAWKEWIQISDNAKYLPALRTVAGDPTIGEKRIAPYFFLINGWKIKPASWNHTLNLVGNLFVDNPETYGSNVVVPPDGAYTVLVNMSTTSDASRVTVGSGVTQQDKQDIANLIKPDIQADIQEVKTDTEDISYQAYGIQGQVAECTDEVETIERHHFEMRRKIEGEYLLYFDDGNVIAKFKLVKDAEGRIIERIPVPI